MSIRRCRATYPSPVPSHSVQIPFPSRHLLHGAPLSLRTPIPSHSMQIPSPPQVWHASSFVRPRPLLIYASPPFLTLEPAVGTTKLAVGPYDEVVAGVFAPGTTYQPSP